MGERLEDIDMQDMAKEIKKKLSCNVNGLELDFITIKSLNKGFLQDIHNYWINNFRELPNVSFSYRFEYGFEADDCQYILTIKRMENK